MLALVTGAAGFIGGHLAQSLAEQGHDVIGLDLVQTNLKGTNERIRWVQGDILDVALVAELMRGVDVVFHQAAVASVPQSFDDPAHCISVNVAGSAVIFEQARLAGAKRVVMASTSAIYGDDPTPIKHEKLIPAPRSPYAVSKLAMEQLADVYARQYGMTMVALRYFNVYGPGQPAEGGYAAVIPAILRSIRTGEPMTVYGDGEQTRSFVYVGDVIRANMLAAEVTLEGPGALVANIAGSSAVSLNELLRTLETVTGFETPIEQKPARMGDIRHSSGSVVRAKEHLGFEPTTPLERGLQLAWAAANHR